MPEQRTRVRPSAVQMLRDWGFDGLAAAREAIVPYPRPMGAARAQGHRSAVAPLSGSGVMQGPEVWGGSHTAARAQVGPLRRLSFAGEGGFEADGRPLLHRVACPAGDTSCTDSRNYDALRDGRRTVRADAAIDDAARANMRSLETRRDNERFGSFTRRPDGTVEFNERQGASRLKGDVLGGRFNVPKGTDATGHSHSNDDQYTLVPGPRDDEEVQRGRPSYITRDGRVIVVEQVDGQYQVREVTGRLTQSERRAVRDRMNEFQDRARPKPAPGPRRRPAST